jgi:mannose/fructose/N-acetylgalactosamine-specific phosphotransferase system component IIC
MAALCLGAQATDAVDEAAVAAAVPVPVADAAVLATLPVPVADAGADDDDAAALVPVPVAAAVPQLAVDCTVTPLAAHICWAKAMVACWSAASQASTRQQEMVEMNSGSAQMHAGSVPQSP